jgi:peptide deformylase
LLSLVESTDPILTREAQKVAFPDPAVAEIVAQMMTTMETQNGCGLAAPQVGIPLRMFVWRDGAESGVVVNPVIIPEGDEIGVMEGCLTFPNQRYRTRRHSSIMCTYYGADGVRVPLAKIDGFRAIIFQHEYDHLVGRLLPHHGQKE